MLKNFGGLDSNALIKYTNLNTKMSRINRFGYREFNGIRSTREYLFFTRPDLNIAEAISSDAFFADLNQKTPQVLNQLQKAGNPYMTLLNNSVRNKLEMPGVETTEIETGKTNFGTSISFRKHSYQSDEGHEFSLEFEDDKTLAVYNLFKAWDRYGNLKSIGMIEPKDQYRNNRELHDQIAIYKFIVDETNSNILFYAKLVGCYPKGVPRDHFSDLETSLTYSVPFKANFVMEMDPLIIAQFNHLSSRGGGGDLPLYNPSTGMAGQNWARSAHVVKHNNRGNPGFTYKLKWRG